MSEKKFTPGPWTIDADKSAIVRMNSYFRIEQTATAEELPEDMTTGKLQEEGVANAKLISAAPEMFEVIKELYDWAQDTQTFGPIYPKLEAAYKKATGN